MTGFIECLYCGEQLEVTIDWSVTEQRYIEDCQACCRPMELAVTVRLLGSDCRWLVYDEGGA